MTDTTTPPTASPITDTYTPAELSYLLAGRTTPGAARARTYLKLAELAEGDPAIVTAVQSLSARGLVSVDANGDDVVIGESAKAIGYLLGTSDDWIRLIAVTEVQNDMVLLVSAPDAQSSLLLRVTPLGTFQAIATRAGVHPSQIIGTMASVYLKNFDNVALHIERTGDFITGELKLEHRRVSDEWIIHRRSGIVGADDVTDAPAVADEKTYLSNLEVLIG